MMRGPALTSISSIQPRVLLFLFLLSGGITLSLSAAIERPADDAHAAVEATSTDPGVSTDGHGETEPSTVEASHAVDSSSEHPTEASSGGEIHAGDGSEGNKDIHATEESTGEMAHATPIVDAIGGDHEPRTLLGVNLDSLNLVSPRLIAAVVGLTALMALMLGVYQSVMLLAAIIGVSLLGLAASVREATHAGEELGIFVPLPILAAVLYAGAGALAGLQIVSLKAGTTSSDSAHH
jgi:hypothetical protein